MVIISSQSFFYGFPSGVGQWRSMAAGNCLLIVSHPAWGSGGAWRQETVCEKFPVRHGALVEHSDRKLFADSFPSGVGHWWSIATGNCSRIVSCPTWDHWWSMAAGNYWRIVSHSAWGSGGAWRQETGCGRFPVWHGAVVEHSDRKLFADSFLSDLGPLEKHGGRKLLAKGFPFSVGRLRIISIGNPFYSFLKVLNFSAILVYNKNIDTVWKGGPL